VALVTPGRVRETARALAGAMTRFSRAPSPITGPTLDQAAAVRSLGDALREALRAGAPASSYSERWVRQAPGFGEVCASPPS